MSNEEIRCELKELRQKGNMTDRKKALAEKYKKAIAILPSYEARIMTLYYIDRRTHGEIAREIYYSVDTVKRILKRGIAMLSKNSEK